MATRKPGRKAAKNETAAGLLNALAFVSLTKKPTETSLPYVSHVWLNSGFAIAFDGVIAAGHPIDAGVAGYPNTKLLIEALENCGKTFELTVREGGAFEIKSGAYHSLVPSLAYTQVIATPPDANQWPITKAFVTAMEAAGKVVSDTAPKLLHSSIRLAATSVMATDGSTIIEAWHGCNMPTGLLLPKAFATALVKTGKEPVGFGIAADWSSFTVHFADGSWVRTQTYRETWPEEILTKFPTFFQGQLLAEVPKGLYDTVKMVLPFADEHSRVIIRPGIIRTHMERELGAAVELPSINFQLDINGKRLLAVEELAATFACGMSDNTPTFVFFGQIVRGVIAGLSPLPEPAPAAAAPPIVGGWTTTPDASPQTEAAAPWGTPTAPAFVSPPAEAAPAPTYSQRTAEAQRDPNKIDGWDSRPADNLANDPDFRDQAGMPPLDLGVDMSGWGLPADEMQQEHSPVDGWGMPQEPTPQPDTGAGWGNTLTTEPEPEPESENLFGGWLNEQKDLNE